jgi:hypothetical protein
MEILMDVIQVALLLSACYASYVAGRVTGIETTVDLFIDKKIITEEQLKRAVDDET